MKKVNYYLRVDGHPKTAITILQQGTKVTRGVAICNPCDQFDKAEGRELSLLRSKKAFDYERSFGKIRRDGLEIDDKFQYKCEYMPDLTFYEIELLMDPAEK